MARLRYVKNSSAGGPAKASGSKIRHAVQSLRAFYETEPEIAKALLPRPLEPAASPEIFVQFANIAMHFSEERTVQIGAATVGVACSYEGRPGYYVLAMPMEGEFVVIGGRERYGEPKKIAETAFSLDGDHVNAKVTRHGVTVPRARWTGWWAARWPAAVYGAVLLLQGTPGGCSRRKLQRRIRWRRLVDDAHMGA